MATGSGHIHTLLGSRVRVLRDVAGVSADNAAIAIDVSSIDYAKLERGELKFKAWQLMALASEFHAFASAFLDDSEMLILDQKNVHRSVH
jgi:hypothetical protein